MILTEEDLKELDCLFKDGLKDGDIGYMHRSNQINLIKSMIKEILHNAKGI